eukprot:977635-Pelagomonas_calceolata.AAC.1
MASHFYSSVNHAFPVSCCLPESRKSVKKRGCSGHLCGIQGETRSPQHAKEAYLGIAGEQTLDVAHKDRLIVPDQLKQCVIQILVAT